MRRNIPSTQALACFEVAARHESYTRAAQELSLTQSAVSRQIIALEEFLGVQLFRRTRHGVVLTPAGAHYGRQVARWLQGLERDTLDVMAHQGEGGTLSLAAVPTFATRWLIPRLPRLAQQHPDIVVHIETQTRPFLFADTTFDAALYAGTPEQVANWPGIQAQWLMNEDVVPVCSPRVLEAAAQRGRGRAYQGVAAEALADLP
ncbi:MAG: LysR family transcriptional regulator, partial [Verminephrobacter sp.]|nr:LysR family transcriptional regulator [Verminephrobacter sp.]